MMGTSSQFFNEIAISYDYALESLPGKFIELICELFNISEGSRVVDLGCGPGLLAVALSQFSRNVVGIDLSEEMLRIACTRDSARRVSWIHGSVEEVDIGQGNDLVISLESFHLFRNLRQLVRRCAVSLRIGGYFCVGWVRYHWETQLYDLLVDEFERHGVGWGTAPNLAVMDLSPFMPEETLLTPLTHKSVSIQARTSVGKIASFLISTHKAASLDPEERLNLKHRLEFKIRTLLSSEWSCGTDEYEVLYSRRN